MMKKRATICDNPFTNLYILFSAAVLNPIDIVSCSLGFSYLSYQPLCRPNFFLYCIFTLSLYFSFTLSANPKNKAEGNGSFRL